MLGNRVESAGIQGIDCYGIDMRATAPINKGGRPYISERTALYVRAAANSEFLCDSNRLSAIWRGVDKTYLSGLPCVFDELFEERILRE